VVILSQLVSELMLTREFQDPPSISMFSKGESSHLREKDFKRRTKTELEAENRAEHATRQLQNAELLSTEEVNKYLYILNRNSVNKYMDSTLI
jgi:hypothetical protein